MMLCACSEYAEVDGLCAVCHAEATFGVRVKVVESNRPRYVAHARLDTKHTAIECERLMIRLIEMRRVMEEEHRLNLEALEEKA